MDCPFARSSGGVRSECVIPRPAVIQVHRRRTDNDIAANTIFMTHRAFEEVCHGCEPNVWMGAYVESVPGRILDRSEMIKEDKWTNHFVGVKRQGPTNFEASAQIVCTKGQSRAQSNQT